MATLLNPKDFLHLLRCSCAGSGSLAWIEDANSVVCLACNRNFTIRNNILELVDASSLDAETARELKGNTHDLSSEAHIRTLANKDTWSSFYMHLQQGNFVPLTRFLKRTGSTQIAALGTGWAYEIKCLSKHFKLDTVLCSDLSYSALYVAPYTLESIDIKLGLFTSNLDDCPLSDTEMPVLIYEALHHTSDMHAALERLMAKGFRQVLLVEPCNNFLMRWLAKRGLAQRVEYSGVKPGRLDLNTLRSLCRTHGYTSSIVTTWHFPEDYFAKICKSDGIFQRVFLFLIDVWSAATRPFHFGNTAICYLKRREDGSRA
jgi:hypothetical protein